MDIGEHQWMIDAKLLDISRKTSMLKAPNRDKYMSPKFKISLLTWQIGSYPDGNTKESKGSCNLDPGNLTICRTFQCEETQRGYCTASK